MHKFVVDYFMEQDIDIKEFLVRIVNTISVILVWMLINMCVGIYFDFAFFEHKPTIWNCLFYIWFIFSFTWVIVHLKKKWKAHR